MSQEGIDLMSSIAEGLVTLFVMWLVIQMVWAGLRGRGLGY